MIEALDQLREIPLPEPVRYVPQTVGWAVLAAVSVVLLILLLLRMYRSWKRDQYRRQALKELAVIDAGSRDARSRVAALRQLSELVKRTALAAWPRQRVAGLSGEDWLTFLDSSNQSTALQSETGRDLLRLAYDRPETLAEIEPERIEALVRQIRIWIRRHRAGL